MHGHRVHQASPHAADALLELGLVEVLIHQERRFPRQAQPILQPQPTLGYQR